VGTGSATAEMVLEACWRGSVAHWIHRNYDGMMEGYKYRGDGATSDQEGGGGGGGSQGRER